MAARDQILELQERMGRSIIGQEHIVERLVIGLLANGNLLVEGLPGLAKTRAVKSLAKNMEAEMSRIQFTPDLLPSDITGTEIHAVHVSNAIDTYIVDLVNATRYPERYGDELKKWLQVGASPRGGISLDKSSRTYAWLHGRDHVTPDDVRAVLHDCLRHRLILGYDAQAEGVTANQVLDDIVKVVAVA